MSDTHNQGEPSAKQGRSSIRALTAVGVFAILALSTDLVGPGSIMGRASGGAQGGCGGESPSVHEMSQEEVEYNLEQTLDATKGAQSEAELGALAQAYHAYAVSLDPIARGDALSRIEGLMPEFTVSSGDLGEETEDPVSVDDIPPSTIQDLIAGMQDAVDSGDVPAYGSIRQVFETLVVRLPPQERVRLISEVPVFPGDQPDRVRDEVLPQSSATKGAEVEYGGGSPDTASDDNSND